jgi:glycosyltransferase involved in cell wall biosynthesis
LTVAFILKGYPRLSESFIAQEIEGLETRGVDIRIVSLRYPTDSRTHPVHDRIKAPVTYLPEYLHREPVRVARAWREMRRRPTYRTTLRAWLRDFRRDPSPNRVRRFGQALVLAHELPAGIERLHAHFLHTPASVVRYAAILTGLPWSCSAHAVDIYTTPEWEKREKLASCDWLVTCTAANRDHLGGFAPTPGKVLLAYHGLDFSRFQPPEEARPDRDGGNPDDPVRILSVGRAVEKKGYDDLLAALAAVPEGLNWRFIHIGGGKLARNLKQLARDLKIEPRVEWLDAQPQATVLANYRAADLFVLACRVARNGDRDGLPNVLMEAQSLGLCCIATDHSGIPELIEDGRTGVLVSPGDRAALADALARLIAGPAERLRLGAAGSFRVRAEFSAEAGLDMLAGRFARATTGKAESGKAA